MFVHFKNITFLKKKNPCNFTRVFFWAVEPNGENANKFNEHLELMLDFMGVLEHEKDLWELIKQA